ncbi:hypothetical protein Tco_1451684, partial [Tanacetum coccineum]
PIACCNVIYKVISKILTNRIKEGFHKLVNLNQSAFIPRRLIWDNLLITQELLKGYTMKNGPKDDLLVLIHGDFKSVGVIKEALDKFSKVSSLIPIGKLRMKYLGVPLIAKKLNVNDCTPLIDKVKNKVLYWKNKGLSGKGKATEIEEDIQDSCTWKATLGLRNIVRKHIIYKIRNGRSTSIWHDNWNDMGQLSQFISYRVIYDARLQNSNTVADLIEENQWKWPDSCKVLDRVVLVEYALRDDGERGDRSRSPRRVYWHELSPKTSFYFMACAHYYGEIDNSGQNDEMKLLANDVLSMHEMQ